MMQPYVGLKIRRRYTGYGGRGGWFEGVVLRLDDAGRCIIAWEDGTESGMGSHIAVKCAVPAPATNARKPLAAPPDTASRADLGGLSPVLLSHRALSRCVARRPFVDTRMAWLSDETHPRAKRRKRLIVSSDESSSDDDDEDVSSVPLDRHAAARPPPQRCARAAALRALRRAPTAPDVAPIDPGHVLALLRRAAPAFPPATRQLERLSEPTKVGSVGGKP